MRELKFKKNLKIRKISRFFLEMLIGWNAPVVHNNKGKFSNNNSKWQNKHIKRIWRIQEKHWLIFLLTLNCMRMLWEIENLLKDIDNNVNTFRRSSFLLIWICVYTFFSSIVFLYLDHCPPSIFLSLLFPHFSHLPIVNQIKCVGMVVKNKSCHWHCQLAMTMMKMKIGSILNIGVFCVVSFALHWLLVLLQCFYWKNADDTKQNEKVNTKMRIASNDHWWWYRQRHGKSATYQQYLYDLPFCCCCCFKFHIGNIFIYSFH